LSKFGNLKLLITAEVLNTTVDFLLNGNTDEKAQATLKDAELLQRFKEIENLPERERAIIIEVY
jgi:DNA-directed RNA polymerase specialized sigma subunit